MSELTVFWDEGERMAVGNELTRLFALQDKSFSQDKKAIFVDELANTNMPVGAVIQGIRSLVHDDLRTIKIGNLTSAARDHMTVEEASSACGQCSQGAVTMRDEQGRKFGLGCICARGGERAKMGRLATWSGEAIQISRGRTLWLIPQIRFSSFREEAAS